MNNSKLITNLDSHMDNHLFIEDLFQFYRSTKSPFSYLPNFFGKRIDLRKFFHSVVKRGGYNKVCDDQEWHSIAKDIGLPVSCENLTISLRRLYYRSLAAYERHKFPLLSDKYVNQYIAENSNGEITNSYIDTYPSNGLENYFGIGFSQRSDVNSNNSLTFPSYLLDASDSGRNSKNDYQYYRAVLPEIRDNCIIPPWDPVRAKSPYDSLHDAPRIKTSQELHNIELSLMSGLSNEIDVALNTLLVISASSANTISLSRNENLLKLLLALIGFVDDDFLSFHQCLESWSKMSRLNFVKFWYESSDDRGRTLIEKDIFPDKAKDLTPDPEMDNSSFLNCPNESSAMGEGSIEMTRVLHIATILLNIITQPSNSQNNNNSSYVNVNGKPLIIPSVEDDLAYDTASISSPLSKYRPRPLCKIKSQNVADLMNSAPPLSTWRDNARFISSSPKAISFVILCCQSKYSYLRNLGYQLLSSNLKFSLVPNPSDFSVELVRHISSLEHDKVWTNEPFFLSILQETFVQKDSILPTVPRISQIVVDYLISSLLDSSDNGQGASIDLDANSALGLNLDRSRFISSTGLLTSLFRVTDNANYEYLITVMPRRLWQRFVDLLILPDLGIVYCILEVLLAITSTGYLGCLTLFQSTNRSQLYQILLSLVNIEGQALGQKSLHRIKLLPRNIPPPFNNLLLNSHHQYQSAFLRSSISANKSHNSFRKTYRSPNSPDEAGDHGQFSLVSLLSNSRVNEVHGDQRMAVSNSSPVKLKTDLKEQQENEIFTSPIERVLANVTPHPTSLSELSDRLQMPPPSLPPPSVLKRAGIIKERLNNSPTIHINGNCEKTQNDQQQPMTNGSSFDDNQKASHNQKGTKRPNDVTNNDVTMVNGNGTVHEAKENGHSERKEDHLIKRENNSVLSDDWKDPSVNIKAKKAKIQLANSDNYPCLLGTINTNSVMNNNVQELNADSPRSDGADSDLGSSSSPHSLDENYLDDISHCITAIDAEGPLFYCEWKGCLMTFESVEGLSSHIYSRHFCEMQMTSRSRANCLWANCSSCDIPRAKFSLLSHLNEVHCSPAMLTARSNYIRKHPFESRSQLRHMDSTPNTAVRPHESYNDQSGLSIIRSVELKRMENEINLNIFGTTKPVLINGRLVNSQMPATLPPREGPVTKHLRVTSALILQNLVKYLPSESKKYTQLEEFSLAEISFGSSPNLTSSTSSSSILLRTNDAAKIVASLLFAHSEHDSTTSNKR